MNHLTRIKSGTLSTEKFEQHCDQVKADIARYRQIEKSKELADFLSLQKIVESKEFQEKKNYYLKRKYRATEEYKTSHRYNLLKIGPMVQRWWAIRSNSSIAEFLEFEKTEEYHLLKDKKAVKADARLRRFKLIDGSLVMRDYRFRAKSKAVKEYLKLRDIVKSDEFIKSNEFWKNPKRWYTLPESEQDSKYMELKKDEDIAFFLSQDAKQIEEWESYKTLFEDDFNWIHMADSDWKPGFHFANKNLKTDHSYANEQQANNKGKNTYAVNSLLTIETKQEDVEATAWNAERGFVPQHYSYTSDIVQTADKFSANGGLFMAKVCFSGIASGAVYLAGGERLPILRLASFNGKQVAAGLRTDKVSEEVVVSDAKANKWYIYSVRWDADQIHWYLNNQEILSTANTLSKEQLYWAVAGFLPQGVKAGEGKIEIDWVRVYKKESK